MEISGSRGLNCSLIVKFALQYAMDRHHFEGGAGVFHIDLENIYSRRKILFAINKKIGIVDNNQDDYKQQLINCLSELKMVLLLDECQNLVKSSEDTFMNLLYDLVTHTHYLKIIVINNSKKKMQP